MNILHCLNANDEGKAARRHYGSLAAQAFARFVKPYLPGTENTAACIGVALAIAFVICVFLFFLTGPFALIGWAIISVWELIEPFPRDVVGWWAHAGWGFIFAIIIWLGNYVINNK